MINKTVFIRFGKIHKKRLTKCFILTNQQWAFFKFKQNKNTITMPILLSLGGLPINYSVTTRNDTK